MPTPHLTLETNWPEMRADAGGYQVYYAQKLNLSNLPLEVAEKLMESLGRAHNQIIAALERTEKSLRLTEGGDA